jgi:hypothetical protein
MFEEKFGNHTWKTFKVFATKVAVLGTLHLIQKILQFEI